MKTDPRVDAYITKSADFAQPMMMHLRTLIHTACPDVEETLKWSMPSFIYKGKILCGMAAFKAHMAFHFWDGAEVTGKPAKEERGMGQFGKMTSMADLPGDAEVIAYVQKGMALIDAGAPTRRRAAKPPKAEIPMPDDLATAMANNDAAAAFFDGLPPSARREYLEWVTTAKQVQTREKRIATTVAQCAEGKRLHWKYEKC